MLEKLKVVLEGLGGKENIDSVSNCSTRLRVEVKNPDKVNKSRILESGAKDVLFENETSVQVVFGPSVEEYTEIFKLLVK